MPSCSTAKHPSGVEITFIEDTHKYFSTIDGKELTYTSGTTFIHKYTPPFDPTGRILESCARKKCVSKEELKRQWDQKRDNSCVFGTNIHSVCEDILLNRTIRFKPQSDKEKNTFKTANEIASKFKDKLDILGVEKIVFNPYLPTPIAGTIDLLARSRKDGSVLILDWKTNEKIDTYNQYNKFCLEPIKHIPDLNYWHYSLQLSLYQYLLKLGKYVPANSMFKRAIIHLTESGYKIMQLPDLTGEIKDLIINEACEIRNRT